jgi:hypothetical protein
MQEQTIFEGWTIIELFGHNVIAGYAAEQSIGGAAFIRVDVPSVDGAEGFTKFFNGSAVYAMTPTDEATAHAAVERLAVRPVSPWVVPVPDSRRELPSPMIDDELGF